MRRSLRRLYWWALGRRLYWRKIKRSPEWHQAVSTGQFNELAKVVFPQKRIDEIALRESPFYRMLEKRGE